MRIRKEIFFLVLIFFLALALRLSWLAKFPAGFNPDEMSQGYTAYSILKTGRDEWGVRYPVAPRAFGDFRSPLYTYLTIPSIAVFGLNVLAVRLPAALFGSLAILVLYLLVKELFKDGFELGKNKISGETLALVSSFFLAISPWHLSLSRGAFEASLNVFFLPLGIWFFLKGLRRWPYFLCSGFIFGLNLFSYYSPRFFTPLTILVLIFCFRKNFFQKKQNLSFFLVFGVFLWLSWQTLLLGGKTRVADTSILNPTDRWKVVAGRQYEAVWYHLPVIFAKAFNNKLISISSQFYKNYLNYFSMNFLFSEGASEATYGMIPGRGVLYLYELPLIIVMIWLVVKKRDKRWILLFWLLLLSSIPASLAKGERAANRAVTMLPFWQIISAGGAIYLVFWLKRKLSAVLVTAVCLFIPAFFLLFFLEDYFYHASNSNASAMAYGWAELGDFLLQNEKNFETIIISGEFSEPQAGVSFFLKIDPSLVQKESLNWLEYEKKGFLFVDQMPEYSLGKYVFRYFHFPEDQRKAKTLLIGAPWEFAGVEGVTEKIIYYPGPDKKIAIKLVSFKEGK